MSMSQEEIEALMNGLDIGDDTSSSADVISDEEQNDMLSQDDIAQLMAETSTDGVVEDDDLDSLINQFSASNDESSLDTEAPDEAYSISDDDLDSILNGISGIQEETIAPKAQEVQEKAIPIVNASKVEEKVDHEVIAKTWTDKQIESGVFPLPVEKHNKVVNQLHQVAKDGEEQATKIFDVLSFLLDENNSIQQNTKVISSFIDTQIKLLDTLSQKYPHIEQFGINLNEAHNAVSAVKEMRSRIDDENNHLFEAMELMQFHDINRQKIERVMAVIKKLANYLNNLFEDETGLPDVKIAKHIHGDTNSELVGNDDLEALIAEFGK